MYYAAQDLDTAVAEVSHHRALFRSRTREPPIDIDLRLITATLDAPLHDLRRLRGSAPALYDPVDYGAGQALARRLREAGSWGVLYHSVRHRGGLCAGIRPRQPRGSRHCCTGMVAHHALVRGRAEAVFIRCARARFPRKPRPRPLVQVSLRIM